MSVSFPRRVQQRVDENRKLGEKLQQVHRVLANETTGKHFDNICHRRSSLCSSVDMPNALLEECLVGGFAASMLVYWSAALQENLKNEKVVQDGIMDGLWRDLIPSAGSGGPQLPSGILAKFFLLGAIFWVVDILGRFGDFADASIPFCNQTDHLRQAKETCCRCLICARV